MIKCTKRQIRELKTALSAPAHSDGSATREQHDAAGDCGGDGRLLASGKRLELGVARSPVT